MLIKLTVMMPTKRDLWIHEKFLVTVERAQDNPLMTLVVTTLQGQDEQGRTTPVVFQCMDSPESIAAQMGPKDPTPSAPARPINKGDMLLTPK